MYVPRWILLSLMVAVAVVSGWALRAVVSEGHRGTFVSADAPSEQWGAEGGSGSSGRGSSGASGTPTNVAVDGGNSAPVINLTIGDSEPSDQSVAQQTSNRPDTGPRVATASSVVSAGDGGARIVYVDGGARLDDVGSSSADDAGTTVVNHRETFLSNDSRITVNGREIVVASDGSIVFQGDNGSLNGNTGDSSSSGSIAIDNNGSTISTGSSGPRSTGPGPTSAPGPAGTPGPTGDLAQLAGTTSGGSGSSSPIVASTATSAGASSNVISGSSQRRASTPELAATPAGGAGVFSSVEVAGLTATRSGAASAALAGAASAAVQSASPLTGWSGGGPGRTVSISGYEDHSITVDGNDQIILYDDSNVFINRSGPINANTGDTDSSGLNVVDAVDSIVRSGNSGDGEGGDDDEDEEEDEDEDDLADVDDAAVAGASAQRGSTATPSSRAATSSNAATTSSTRSPTGSVGAQVMAARTSAPVGAAAGGRSSGWVDDEDTTTYGSGDDVLIIGGDGYDDLGVRSRGNGNVVVYDDSNLVVGGAGKVNAQIGDSDTAGAVVMGVRNSIIEAGCEGDLCPLYRR